ncbi:DsbA family protein [Patescibacteria group bacterium]|nr:DsbA family protein [Patescibacteria group bacterium]MBU1075371.1 DsbA family protein [Patescibacteria group bacterium]MBU1951885.1 DsbA family protein [Patescibacteria group bacterium]
MEEKEYHNENTSQRKNISDIFSVLGSKRSFILGIIAAVFFGSITGFFVLLFSNSSSASIVAEKVSTTNANTNSAVAKPTQPSDTAPTAGTIVSIPIDDSDHIRGNVNALVTIVEYSDFECPYCNRFHPTMQQALAEYGDNVRWVYKHFPLDSIHSNARPAAIASECAASLGGNDVFWSFADGLFENQSGLGDDLYKEIAADLGLDATKFEECYSSKATADKVQEDYTEGQQLGVNGTPGNFVNGLSVPGAVPFESLKQVIDSQL